MIVPEGSTFDVAKADAAIKRIESFKLHVGEFAGKPIQLLPWQRDFISQLFGIVDIATGFRTYREAFVFIPTKNGKTTLASAIALYFLGDETEPGGELYAAGPSQEQSDLTFRCMLGMIENSEIGFPVKSNRTTKTIRNEGNATFFRSLSSDADLKHGLNANLVICDELHAFPDRALFDVLQSRTGSRRQPLFLTITTAGSSANPEHVCYQAYKYACQVRDGIVKDHRFLPVIYEAAPTDDPFDSETWFKAQPSLGIVKKLEEMERRAAKAKASLRERNRFLRDDLNLWITSDEAWLNPDEWLACVDESIDLKALEGRSCSIGLDLSANTDLTALVQYFPNDDGTFTILPYFWLPEASIEKREQKDKENYRLWHQLGFINLSDGEIINQEEIRQFIHQLAQKYNVMRIGIDPRMAAKLAGDLTTDGFDCGYVAQNTYALSPSLRDLETNIRAKRIRHANHPILNWNIGNAVVYEGQQHDIRLLKEKSVNRIDGTVALALAAHSYLSLNKEGKVSTGSRSGGGIEWF